MPDITITVSDEVAARLAVLGGAGESAAAVAEVVAVLVDHAQQGVYRPGANEREWVCQVFGYEWTARLVPDTRPEMLSGDGRVIFERPALRQDGTGEGSGDG